MVNTQRTTFQIHQDIKALTLDIYARDGEGSFAQPVVFVPGPPVPMVCVSMEDTSSLQQLMDELWRVGIRPTEGKGSAGALAATERHLADMQSLVDKLLPSALRKP